MISNKISSAIKSLRQLHPTAMPLGFFAQPFNNENHLWCAIQDGADFKLAIVNLEDGKCTEVPMDATAGNLIKIMCGDAMEEFLKDMKKDG